VAYNLELNYEGDNNTARGPFGNNWEGMTFTTVGAFTLAMVSLYMFETGTSPDATLYIYATAAGVPTGAALGQATITSAMVGAAAAWVDVVLDSGVSLNAATQYAFVLANPSGNTTNRFSWYLDTTSPTYSGGSRVYSSNGGSSWNIDTTDDVNFRLYSESVAGIIQQVMHHRKLLAGV